MKTLCAMLFVLSLGCRTTEIIGLDSFEVTDPVTLEFEFVFVPPASIRYPDEESGLQLERFTSPAGVLQRISREITISKDREEFGDGFVVEIECALRRGYKVLIESGGLRYYNEFMDYSPEFKKVRDVFKVPEDL